MEEEIENGRNEAEAAPAINPYRDDPVFKSKQDLKTYLEQNTSSSDSGDDMETGLENTALRETCVCGECEEIMSKEGFQHKCCDSYKARIQENMQ